MKQKLKHLALALTIALTGGLMCAPALVSADLKGDACQGVNALNNSSSTTCPQSADNTINNLGRTVIQIFSVVVGFIAVIMIVVGGLRLMTANGDSGAIATARSALVYALVGLAIVAFAQILVHFVIFKVSK